ncbi:MAG: BREX-3 system phosphatase PglZ [Acidiferrobacter sp.]
MSLWIERILREFPSDLAQLWVAADPDGVLLDEQILSLLRARGFAVLPFEDSVAFRAEYEERYREAWDRNEQSPARALVLHLRSAETGPLPWDYLRQARIVPLSLASLFSKLSYGVVRQIATEHLEALFDAQSRYASQSLGEAATKEFVLTHIFRIGPHLLSRPEDLWRELLRLHYRGASLPPILAAHVAQILGERDAFKGLPIAELFASKSTMLRIVQDAWDQYLEHIGVSGYCISESLPVDGYAKSLTKIAVPFAHPDVRAIIDSMFLDGTLHPFVVQGMLTGIPEWAKVGIVQDPAAMRNLVRDGIKSLSASLPTLESSHRDWSQFARHFGEIVARFHGLDTAQADGVRDRVTELQRLADERLHAWVAKHYADLPSLPVAKGPVMVHHVPRFLSMRRNAGEDKIALLVFDGLAVDQWIQIREHVAKRLPKIGFEEGACFAWVPTLTCVSRQALFSGLKPREFADSIETTAQEPSQWSRFWQDQGLRANEVMYRKGIKRVEQLEELETAMSDPAIKVVGLVVDTIDEIVHGAVLGKRGIANQIDSWCESGFVDRLFVQLLNQGYHVYLTADHGNVEAVGVGRPNQGVIAETCGERVRVYRSEALLSELAIAYPDTVKLEIAGLPVNFMPLFAGARTAFITQGERLVAHGGISVEELIVPFVKVTYVN